MPLKSILLACLWLLSFFQLMFQYACAQSTCTNIGVNLSGSAYWENGEDALIDQMKYQGTWFAIVGWTPTTNINEFSTDSNGYINCGIPYATTAGKQKAQAILSSSGRTNAGKYVFLYDGYGQFSFGGGITIDTLQPGRLVVTITGTGNMWITIDSSSVSPNHARNFRLVPKSEEFTYRQDVFRKNFLEKLSPFSHIRFMDWFRTNTHPVGTWSKRTTPTHYTQADSTGYAYEWAIKLANMTQKTPWVCVPHLADSVYITNMARLFRDSLNKNLNVYLEYSNEVWNFSFAQTHWAQNLTGQYPAWWPANTLYNSSINGPKNVALLMDRVFRIWRNEFASDSLRVIRVLATQCANSWVSGQMIAQIGNNFDYVSPAPYFGLTSTAIATFTTSTTAQEVVDSCRSYFYKYTWKWLLNQETEAAKVGKKIIFYEAGQHLTANGNGSLPALPAYYAAQSHPGMYQIYDAMLDSMRQHQYPLMMAFVLGGENSKWGSWGHIRDVDSVPSMSYCPKYMALLHNLPDSVQGCNPANIRILLTHPQTIFFFPNPSGGEFSIEFPDQQKNSPVTVEIYSVLGELVWKQKYAVQEKKNTATISTQNLAEGQYLVLVTDDEQFFTEKLVVINK